VYTSNPKKEFTDFRAPCATFAHFTTNSLTTGYAKLVSARSKTAFSRAQPFPPIRRRSNNRPRNRPADTIDRGQQFRVLRVFRGSTFSRCGRGPRKTRSTRKANDAVLPGSCGVPPTSARNGSIIPTSLHCLRASVASQARNRATRGCAAAGSARSASRKRDRAKTRWGGEHLSPLIDANLR